MCRSSTLVTTALESPCRPQPASEAKASAATGTVSGSDSNCGQAESSFGRRGLSEGLQPHFTLKTIRDAIPKHCFQRSAAKGFAYIAADVFELVLWTYVLLTLDSYVCGVAAVRAVLWSAYWFYAGTTLFGLWIIGHDCGHHAFSEYDWVSDGVGFVLYTLLFTPFYSWQAGHNKHHQFTSHIEHDDPWAARVWDGRKNPVRSTVSTLVKSLVVLTVGIPCYLLFDLGGVGWLSGEVHSYFSTTAPHLRPKDAAKVYFNNMVLGLWACLLYQLCQRYPLLATLYFPSLVVCYAYLAVVTMLHHTHPNVPRLGQGDWSWLKGAMCSIDRSMGWFLDYKGHMIVNTHVCHHIFPKMPFYHCQEATQHIKAVLGPTYYNRETASYLASIWLVLKNCNYVQASGNAIYHWVMRANHQ